MQAPAGVPGGLGEDWVAEDMEGVEGGKGGEGVDSEIVLADPEDGGTPRDKFAWGIWVGMVRNQREYGAKWGVSKKGGGGQQVESQGGVEGGGWGCYYHAARVLSGAGGGIAPGGAVFQDIGKQPQVGPSVGQAQPAPPAVHSEGGEQGAGPPLEGVLSPLDRVNRC